MLGYIMYDLLYTDYFLITYAVLFLIIPVFVGLIVDLVSEKRRERRVDQYLTRKGDGV